MEGPHTIQELICRSDYITKVDLSNFYMHFLIGQANHIYMRFMWEGKKVRCIGMRGFGPKACYKNDGTHDPISLIVWPPIRHINEQRGKYNFECLETRIDLPVERFDCSSPKTSSAR